MKQQVMLGPRTSALLDAPIPTPGKGEVLVKIKYCGVCRSEYEAWTTAQAGRRFGHETMGHIERVGEGVTGFAVGDRVSALGYPALAEYVVFKARHTCKVPDSIADEDAAIEPLSCLVSAVSKLPLPTLGDKTAVVGCGYMGLGAISLLKTKGAGAIIAIDTRQQALEDALRYGATEAYLPQDIPEKYFATWENGFSGGIGLVSEWGGNNATLDLAGRLCAINGTLGIGAYHAGDRRLVDMQLWNYKAISIIMAHERDDDHLFRCGQQGYELMALGRWNFTGLRSKIYPLDQFDLAMEESATKPGGFIKGIIDCGRLSNEYRQYKEDIMKQCDAVWIVADGVAEVHPTAVGDLGPYDLLIETKACGVCAWDAYLFHGQSAPGDFPYVIGHESVGIVREVGPLVKHYKPGDKVFCASGGNAMMAEFFVQDASCCAKLPEDTQDWAKAVLEPVCCVVNLLEKSHIRPGDDVVVVGAGYMGLLTLQGLTRGSWAGEISAFELKPERIALAKKLGVKHVYDPNSEEGKAYIQRIKDKGGAQVVIEFAATDSGYELALQLTRHNAGHLVLGSWHRHGMKFDGTQWHMSGVTVHNLSPMSNANYSEMIPRTAALYTRGVYTPGDYVTHTAHFRDAKDMNALFARAGTKEDGYIKGAILF